MDYVPTHPAKRIFDCVVSISILIFFSPLIFLFLVLIFLEHCMRLRPFDPLFYTETRWSEGKEFPLHKFNIFKQEVIDGMRERGEFIHTKTLERNNSLLYIGWVLKQIYLDELPQLWNVLVGDMSIVGPRPMNAEVHKELTARGENDKNRIRAGITGHYQASCKLNCNSGSQLELDRYYVEYCAHNPWYKVLLFDMTILYRIIKVIIKARGI